MTSGLSFGTSGLRGLAAELIGPEARRYVRAFLQGLVERGEAAQALYLGCDFRDSSPQIIRDCAAAAAEFGVKAVFCGTIPTPALAAHAMAAGAPSIMVTGSHIPQDRNGLKFYTPHGEISKADEAAIVKALAPATPGDYAAPMADEAEAARQRYRARYAEFLSPGALAGKRIGVFEHSSVARDLLAEILRFFGADVVPLGRVNGFVAVDTEAFGDPIFAPLAEWVRDHQLDAVVSTDGDADRPLLMDNEGHFVRGDVLGLLTARFIEADSVVTPVTSNTAIEATGYFSEVLRTRVGSPYVIEAMEGLVEHEGQRVIGFEANGGTLLGSDLSGSTTLGRLMTRDAVLPLLGALGLASRHGMSISDLVANLPLRAAMSNRLENVPQEASRAFLARLGTTESAAEFFAPRKIIRSAAIDGLQFWLEDGSMIHYRASGNAPELRCYVEADSREQAERALEWGLAAAGEIIGR